MAASRGARASRALPLPVPGEEASGLGLMEPHQRGPGGNGVTGVLGQATDADRDGLRARLRPGRADLVGERPLGTLWQLVRVGAVVRGGCDAGGVAEDIGAVAGDPAPVEPPRGA